MAKINLLPWREAYRDAKKKEFIVILLMVLAASGFVAYLWVSQVQAAIADQTARNRLLNTEIAELYIKVDQIQVLRWRREQILVLMRVYMDLESTRQVMLRVGGYIVIASPVWA